MEALVIARVRVTPDDGRPLRFHCPRLIEKCQPDVRVGRGRVRCLSEMNSGTITLSNSFRLV